jgi:DNA polymerase I-like protein with 3'-5' exonuclease and polymerase domains
VQKGNRKTVEREGKRKGNNGIGKQLYKGIRKQLYKGIGQQLCKGIGKQLERIVTKEKEIKRKCYKGKGKTAARVYRQKTVYSECYS